MKYTLCGIVSDFALYNVIKPEVDETNGMVKIYFVVIGGEALESYTCRVISPIDFRTFDTFKRALTKLFDKLSKAEYGSDKMNPAWYDVDRSRFGIYGGSLVGHASEYLNPFFNNI